MKMGKNQPSISDVARPLISELKSSGGSSVARERGKVGGAATGSHPRQPENKHDGCPRFSQS